MMTEVSSTIGLSEHATIYIHLGETARPKRGHIKA
jgi:hypothetical protein